MALNEIASLKKEMRASVLRRRAEIDPDERVRRSQAICEEAFCVISAALASSCDATNPRVAVFSSFGSEVSLSRFEELATDAHVTLCYPAMVGCSEEIGVHMEFFELPEQMRVLKDADFLVHPAREFDREALVGLGCVPVREDEIDCALVPLVAYDDRGGRLGYGGGNYDAFLEKRRVGVAALGIAFLEQHVQTVPREAHDMSLDGVIAG